MLNYFVRPRVSAVRTVPDVWGAANICVCVVVFSSVSRWFTVVSLLTFGFERVWWKHLESTGAVSQHCCWWSVDFLWCHWSTPRLTLRWSDHPVFLDIFLLLFFHLFVINNKYNNINIVYIYIIYKGKNNTWKKQNWNLYWMNVDQFGTHSPSDLNSTFHTCVTTQTAKVSRYASTQHFFFLRNIQICIVSQKHWLAARGKG